MVNEINSTYILIFLVLIFIIAVFLLVMNSIIFNQVSNAEETFEQNIGKVKQFTDDAILFKNQAIMFRNTIQPYLETIRTFFKYLSDNIIGDQLFCQYCNSIPSSNLNNLSQVQTIANELQAEYLQLQKDKKKIQRRRELEAQMSLLNKISASLPAVAASGTWDLSNALCDYVINQKKKIVCPL